MNNAPLSFIPRPVPRRRKAHAEAAAPAPSPPPPPPPPPPTEVLVVSVTVAGPYQLEFEFSMDVTCDGSGSGQPVVEMPFFGWEGAVASAQVAPNVVRFTFSDDQIVGGIAWEISGVPGGLDLHGATMPVPQAGVVQ